MAAGFLFCDPGGTTNTKLTHCYRHRSRTCGERPGHGWPAVATAQTHPLLLLPQDRDSLRLRKAMSDSMSVDGDRLEEPHQGRGGCAERQVRLHLRWPRSAVLGGMRLPGHEADSGVLRGPLSPSGLAWPCPDYVEILDEKQAASSYELNCSPVRVLPPGGSAIFEMRFAVRAAGAGEDTALLGAARRPPRDADSYHHRQCALTRPRATREGAARGRRRLRVEEP